MVTTLPMLHVSVSSDELSAKMSWVSEKPVTIDRPILEEKLKEYGITYGIKTDVIESILQNPEILKSSVLIAEGKKATNPQPQRLIWRPGLTGEQEIENFRDLSPIHKTVFPEDPILKVIPSIAGSPGTTIKGNPISAIQIEEFKVKSSSNISYSAQDETYYAQDYGVIEFENNEIKLVSGIHALPNKMELKLDFYPYKSREAYIEKLKTHLDKLKIVKGLDWNKIQNSIIQVIEEDVSLQAVVVAQGQPPMTSRDAQIKWIHSPYVGNLKSDLENKSVKQHKWEIIKPNEIVLNVSIPQESIDGYDIYGNTIAGQAGKELTPNYSEDFIYTEQTRNLSSQKYGIIYVLENGRIELLPLLRVSEDKMKALFIFYPGSKDTNFISSLLKNEGIKQGILNEEIKTGYELATQNNTLLEKIVAHGVEPIQGEDGTIECLFDSSSGKIKAGTLREDGSMDFKQVMTLEGTHPDEHLLTVHPPKEGKDGINIYGEVVEGQKGKLPKVKTGRNVRVSEEGDKFYSEIEGVISYANGKISVDKTFKVDENVDYHTGNIDFNGAVIVNGNVLPGFEVKAEGDITIKGTVEGGKVFSGGNVVIDQGIIHESQLEAAGKITAAFIQDSTVTSGDNMDITTSIINSTVRCGGILTAKSGLGIIIGGNIHANHSVIANIIGRENEPNTFISAGFDPELISVEVNIKAISANLSSLNEVIMPIVNDPNFKAENMTPGLKEKLGLLKQLKEALKKLEEQKEKMSHSNPESRITVIKNVFPGTKIRIGKYIHRFKDMNSGLSFYESLEEKRIGWY